MSLSALTYVCGRLLHYQLLPIGPHMSACSFLQYVVEIYLYLCLLDNLRQGRIMNNQ